MYWRDLIAMFMLSPNPRSGSGLPTHPKSVPIDDPRFEGMSVAIGYGQLWFRQFACNWKKAHEAYENPLGQVVDGGAAEGDDTEDEDEDEAEDDADVRLDDAGELARQRIEEKAAKALERARRQAARQAEQVPPFPRALGRGYMGGVRVRRRHACGFSGQFMEDKLRDVLPAALRLWIELNLFVSTVSIQGVVMYHYHITPAGLSSHGLNTKNAAGRSNTRGPLHLRVRGAAR